MALVKLFANLRSMTGQKEIDLPGKDVDAVLEALTKEYPALKHFLFKNGNLRTEIILTLNGQILDAETCLDAPVSEQDQIAIFPPVAGG